MLPRSTTRRRRALDVHRGRGPRRPPRGLWRGVFV